VAQISSIISTFGYPHTPLTTSVNTASSSNSAGELTILFTKHLYPKAGELTDLFTKLYFPSTEKLDHPEVIECTSEVHSIKLPESMLGILKDFSNQ
jgi:hypothetical protein